MGYSKSTLRLDARRLKRDVTPVLLVGGINNVRAFGLGGIPVIVAWTHRDSPAMYSRYCAGTCILPGRDSGKAVVEELLRVGDDLAEAGFARIPLFCGEDHYLAVLNEYRNELQTRFLLALNDPPVASALINKASFQDLAEMRGLPVPRRLNWDELEGFAAPVLVKPVTKTDSHRNDALRSFFLEGSKGRVFESGVEPLLGNPDAREMADILVLQEHVPGDDRSIWSFHGFADESGEVLGWFIGRKIRTCPPHTGESSYLELAHEDTLAALGHEIARKIPLKGIFKIDFKRSSASGKFYMLEVNARCNLWLYLGARNGVNLAAIACEYLARGSRPAHVAMRTDYRWLNMRLDFQAYRSLSSMGELGFMEWVWSLVAFRKVYSLFCWDDPVPFLWQMFQRARAIPRRIRRAL